MCPVHTVSWSFTSAILQVCVYLNTWFLLSKSLLPSVKSFCPSNPGALTSQNIFSACRPSRKAGSPGLKPVRPLSQPAVSSVNRRPLLRRSAWPRRCRRGSTWPARAAAPGPPGSRPSRGPGRGSSGPRGGCRRRWHRGEVHPATGRAPGSTGGRWERGRRRPQGAHLHREMGHCFVLLQ